MRCQQSRDYNHDNGLGKHIGIRCDTCVKKIELPLDLLLTSPRGKSVVTARLVGNNHDRYALKITIRKMYVRDLLLFMND